MSNSIEISREILESCTDGFHRYDLSTPMHPDYVSQSLCEMLQCTADELLASQTDAYAALVHPEDRERYACFLCALAVQEQRQTLTYRLLRKSGEVLHVRDTMTSRRDSDGVLRGYSALTDVTEIKRENAELQSLNETLPCGILKYTCSESPQVTYVNDRMLHILRFSDQSPEANTQLEQYKQNIYLHIAPEERLRFKRFLDLVQAHDKPFAGEITALRCDGTRIRLYGWICKSIGPGGEEEFQSVCMDVTERYERKRRREKENYLRALSQVYDEICELDLSARSIRFLKGHYSNALGSMSTMPLVLEDAARFWIDSVVVEEDRPQVRSAFQTVISSAASDSEDCPVQTEFRVCINDGSILCYTGVFLRTGSSTRLFCCRNITRQKQTDALLSENSALRSLTNQMHELVMTFTDGMLAFEICSDSVRPLYISRNVYSFFGYDESEWLASMQSLTPIRDFVSKCHISYEDFLELLENREAEFHYTDLTSQRTRRIKALFTARSEDSERRCYVMLYDITDKDAPASLLASETVPDVPRVYIRTFGYFDVFIDGNPIAFRNEKAKELFALLVDRRGGFVTSSEAISLLWEDEPTNAVTLARYRKVALRLKNTLEEYGIADIVESVDGKRRIVSRLVRCDLYEYLSGDAQYAQLFKGSYLQNYSWGEMTLAELSDSYRK